jgi:phage terminase large subunit
VAAARRVVIPYAPRRQFLPFHLRTERWAVIVAHRRAGKTVACINDLVSRAIQCDKPDGRYAYVAPLYNQAKDVAWTYLKRYAQPICAAEPNESELRVDLVNGARIRLYGADNPDRLRGLYLDGVIMDEYADMRPSVWGEIIRPMLADRQGWATFIGTPKGRNEFFEVWDRAQTDQRWYHAILKASETGLLPKEELVDAAGGMTPEQYEQEFECSFDAAILGAYYGKEMAEAQRAGRIRSVPIDPDIPVNTAWDLGNGDHMAIWCWQAVGPEIRVVDFLQSYGYDMEKYCADLDARGYHGIDWVPHDARVKSMESGKTRVETLIRLGRKPKLVTNHHVEDGINAARVEFKRIWFDAENCKDGLEALRQYQAEFDEKLRSFKSTPRPDWASHPADAFRYLCMAYREVFPAPEAERPRHLEVGPGNTMTLDDAWSHGPQQSPRI